MARALAIGAGVAVRDAATVVAATGVAVHFHIALAATCWPWTVTRARSFALPFSS